MTLPSARLGHAVRRFADQGSARVADIPPRPFLATITTVTSAGASDGHALIKATWNGQESTVNGYPDSYTPAIGHRVLCLNVDHQLFVIQHNIGHP